MRKSGLLCCDHCDLPDHGDAGVSFGQGVLQREERDFDPASHAADPSVYLGTLAERVPLGESLGALKKEPDRVLSDHLGSLVIVVPASYVVSRMSKKKRYAFVLGLFFTRMIPSVAIALPISVTFLKMDLIDTSLGLVLADMITQIPFMAWILVSTFAEVPVALDEAAWIDGRFPGCRPLSR